MGFGFRVGVPGMSVRVSTRGVRTSFSDNPAAGCAVGVDGSVLSVVVRQQDLDSMSGQTPGLTPGGRPTLKNLTERDLSWLVSAKTNRRSTRKRPVPASPAAPR